MTLRAQNGRPALGPTLAYATQDAASESRPRPRCRFARSSAPATDTSGELHRLLHTRLRLASLITAGPMLFFLAKNYFDPADGATRSEFFAVQAAVTAVTLLLTAYIWLRRTPCWRELRTHEIVLFGTVACFFAWLQYVTVATDAYCGPIPASLAGPIFHLLTVANSLRWFFLIVVYGVFIPNTWRRCAVTAVATAIVPLVLTVLFAYLRGWMGGELLSVLSDTAVVMLIAVAVAVFGSYRINVLQQQAHEARAAGAIPSQEAARRRRHGRGLPRRTHAAAPAVRGQADPAGADAGPDQPAALRARGAGDGDADALEHRRGVRLRPRGGRHLLLRHGVFAGQKSRNAGDELRPAVAGADDPFLAAGVPRLREAHGVGLLHRDIKPSNIIACERGGVYDVAKLLDFGLVQTTGLGKDAEKLTVVGSVVGSPPYMAPEQATGREDLDGRGDVYSLGGVGYFLLTGQPPFVKDTAMEMMLAHAYETPRPPSEVKPDLPRDLEEVILRCLKKKPDERYPDADSLEKALARCADANGWTEEDAAAWWREARFAEAPGTDAALPAPTVKQPTTA